MNWQIEDIEIQSDVGRPRLVQSVVIESSPRWVRAWFGGEVVADSKRALLAFEPRRLPVYWFPAGDVRMDLLTPCCAGRYGGLDTMRLTLNVGDQTVKYGAWSYAEPDAERQALRGHLALYWNSMDAWYEEEEEVFVHPRDPYSRVDILQSSRRVRVELDGQVLAESSRPRLLFETGLPTRYYLPAQDVRLHLLEPSETTSRCPYKGEAVYWNLHLGGRIVSDIVWSYPRPIPEAQKLEKFLCFFNERVDIFVDDILQPRPVTEWS